LPHAAKGTPAYEAELAKAREWKRQNRDKAKHAETERQRYYAKLALNPRPKRVPKPPQPKVVLAPLVDVPTGHPLYAEALEVLHPAERRELGGDMDSSARDLLQTYVLARLEGHDPIEALKAIRRRIGQDRRILVHGLSTVTGLER
jgi:hypothetical protein